jgi:hypothetical protein
MTLEKRRALEFLRSHNYMPPSPHDGNWENLDEEKVSFVKGSGDCTWNRYASENSWHREGLSSCCLGARPSDNYCAYCGVGVNNVETWIRSEKLGGIDQLIERIEESVRVRK